MRNFRNARLCEPIRFNKSRLRIGDCGIRLNAQRLARMLVIVAACSWPFSAKAAPSITVSGNSVSILGSAQTISLTCTLVDPNSTGMLRSGANIITVFVTSTATPGTTATCGPLYANDTIQDGQGNFSTTYYKVAVFPVSGGIVASTPALQQFYAFTGSGTVDLSTATPLAPSFFAGPSGSVVVPGSFTVSGTTTTNLLNGCTYVNASQSFASALGAAPNPGCIQVTPGTYPVSANATVPSGIGLSFSKGGVLSIANAVTLTIASPIYASPDAQIFSYTGSGVASLTGQNVTVYPQWFPGADVCAQMNNAYTALPSTGGTVDGSGYLGTQSACAGGLSLGTTASKPERLLLNVGVTIPLGAPITVGRASGIIGGRGDQTVFTYTGNTECINTAANTNASEIYLKNLQCLTTSTGLTSTSNAVIHLIDAPFAVLEDVWINCEATVAAACLRIEAQTSNSGVGTWQGRITGLHVQRASANQGTVNTGGVIGVDFKGNGSLTNGDIDQWKLDNFHIENQTVGIQLGCSDNNTISNGDILLTKTHIQTVTQTCGASRNHVYGVRENQFTAGGQFNNLDSNAFQNFFDLNMDTTGCGGNGCSFGTDSGLQNVKLLRNGSTTPGYFPYSFGQPVAFAFGADFPEFAGPQIPASSGHDGCYGDSTLHMPKCNYNGGTSFPLPLTGNTAGTHSDSGFYQTATAAGCTTAASIGGVCATAITITWPVAFQDANYKLTCTPIGTPTNLPSNPFVVTPIAASVTVNYYAITAAAASWPNVECTAVHN